MVYSGAHLGLHAAAHAQLSPTQDVQAMKLCLGGLFEGVWALLIGLAVQWEGSLKLHIYVYMYIYL